MIILYYSYDYALLRTSFLEVCILCTAFYDNADNAYYNGHNNEYVLDYSYDYAYYAHHS